MIARWTSNTDMQDLFARMTAPDAGERALNYMVRPHESGMRLLGRSGLVPQFDLGGAVRAMTVHRGKTYAVANGALWRLDGSAVNLGAVTDGETFMASGDTQIAIVVAGLLYVYDSDAVTLGSYASGVIEDPIGIWNMDRYFILAGSYGGRDDAFQVSALGDATTWNALDFAFTESNPDALVGCIVDHGEFWALGEETVEKFYNSGAEFPLTRINGGILEKGCAAASTVAKADNRVFWIGQDRVVYAGSGAEAQVVSKRWVEDALAVATIEGLFVLRDRGADLLCIRRTDDTSLVFDITNWAWHERSTGLFGDSWIATCRVNYRGTEYIGTDSGKVCTLDAATYTDDGIDTVAEAVSPRIMQVDPFVISRIKAIYGGGQVDIGRTPQVMLQVTHDGRKWGREKWRDLPKIGQFHKEVNWRALGQSDYWQVRVRITDPVNRDIEGVFYG